MGYRTFASMKIALIGTGEVAEAYALRYAQAGHEVLMAWKEEANTSISPALAEMECISFCSIEDAAAAADLIVIASSPIHVREVAYWMGDVRRKVIIDATSNINAHIDEQVKTVCAIKAITGSQHIVKVFSTRGYEQMLKPMFQHENVQLILVGDSKKAKEVVKILTIDLGVNLFFDMGGNEAIPLFNAMTSAWRKIAGEQQKVVSASGAKHQNLKL